MKILKIQLLAILFTLFYCAGSMQVLSQPSRFSVENYISAKGDTLRYRQLFPDYDTLRKYPLVIFLHGSGERGNDNDAQLKWGVMNFATDENMKRYPAIVIAPQCPLSTGWANIGSREKGQLTMQPTPSKTMQLLIELLKQTVAKLPIDTNRIYITGLSMGGFGTFDCHREVP